MADRIPGLPEPKGDRDDFQYTQLEYTCIRAMASMLREFRMIYATSSRARDTDQVVQDIREISEETIEED